MAKGKMQKLYPFGDARSPDGERWTREPSPTGEELFAIALGAGGFVAVAGVETIIFSADGRSWLRTGVSD